MNVFVVMGWMDNGEVYEDRWFEKKMYKIFSTREKALEYIMNSKGECFHEMWVSEEELIDLTKRYSAEIDEKITEEYYRRGYDRYFSLDKYKTVALDTYLCLERYLSEILKTSVQVAKEVKHDVNAIDIRVIECGRYTYGFNIIEQEVE